MLPSPASIRWTRGSDRRWRRSLSKPSEESPAVGVPWPRWISGLHSRDGLGPGRRLCRRKRIHEDFVTPLLFDSRLHDSDGEGGEVKVAVRLRNLQAHLDDGGFLEAPGEGGVMAPGDLQARRIAGQVPIQIEGSEMKPSADRSALFRLLWSRRRNPHRVPGQRYPSRLDSLHLPATLAGTGWRRKKSPRSLHRSGFPRGSGPEPEASRPSREIERKPKPPRLPIAPHRLASE